MLTAPVVLGQDRRFGSGSDQREPDVPTDYPQPSPHRDPPIEGVYVIFGPRGVYVGESSHVVRRLRHVVACGFDWTIIRYMQNSDAQARRQQEVAIMRRYLQLGIPVVSREIFKFPEVLTADEADFFIARIREGAARYPLVGR